MYDIKVSIVVEVVNGFMMFEVICILIERDILLVLDVFVSVGGVIVFYFEWV